MEFIAGLVVVVIGWLWWSGRSARRDEARYSPEDGRNWLSPDFRVSIEADEVSSRFRREHSKPARVRAPAPSAKRLAAARHFDMIYGDASGEVTRRRIAVLSISRDIPPLIEAWCFLRNEQRRFRPDRIRQLVDLETGEIIDDPVRHFAPQRRRGR